MTRFIQILAAVVVVLALVYFSAIYFVPEILVIAGTIVSIFIPFIIAALLALLMEPMVQFFAARTRMGRPLASGLSMLVIFGSLGFLIVLAVFRLVRELVDLSVSLPRYVKPVQDFIVFYFEQSKIFYFNLPPEVTARISENLGSLTGTLSNLAGSVANFLLNFASALPGAVLGIVVTFIATYFFSKDRRLIVRLWVSVLPHPWGEKSLEVARTIAHAFLNYVRAQAFLISLTTLQAILGLYILGAKYALTVGILIGILDMIPVLGPAGIIIPWAVWNFIIGNIAFGVKLTILYLFIWIVRQVLEARVVATNLGLHPLAVLMVMYIGLKLIGVPGLILGPILLIAVQATLKAVKRPE
jgi:sporulation integral membrane protein YtvI